MKSTVQSQRKRLQMSTGLLLILLITGTTISESTWLKVGGTLVKEQVYSNSQDSATESDLGYGLISTPYSLGTDNFSFMSAAGPTIEANDPARNYKYTRFEFKGGFFIPRSTSISTNGGTITQYLVGVDKGYILCTGKGSTIFYCRGEKDISQSFAVIPAKIDLSPTIYDQLVSHHKYRPLISKFITATKGFIHFFDKNTASGTGFVISPAHPKCQIDTTNKVKFIAINFKPTTTKSVF